MAMTQPYFQRMRDAVTAQLPGMLALYDTIAGEALFAREWLNGELAALPVNARILEVGGGTFLLSCLLAEEGFTVTSIEPVGSGFGEFAELAKLILAHAKAVPTIAACRAEDFHGSDFDFAFSVNVMEHVDDVDAVIGHVATALKSGARYRFFCPNYLFPYEPHFNIPIILTKQLTHRLLRKKIDGHSMPDPQGAWRSLNWIDVPAVRRAAKKHGLALTLRTDIFAEQLERATRDAGFAARRGSTITHAITLFTALRLHRLTTLVPSILQPTMDVTLKRGTA